MKGCIRVVRDFLLVDSVCVIHISQQSTEPIEEPYVTDDGPMTDRSDTLETHPEIDDFFYTYQWTQVFLHLSMNTGLLLIDKCSRSQKKSNLSLGVFLIYPIILLLGHHLWRTILQLAWCATWDTRLHHWRYFTIWLYWRTHNWNPWLHGWTLSLWECASV